jgi:hypothetical protein
MALKYINIFPSKAIQNLPKFGSLVWKETIWQTWSQPPKKWQTLRIATKKWNWEISAQIKAALPRGKALLVNRTVKIIQKIYLLSQNDFGQCLYFSYKHTNSTY